MNVLERVMRHARVCPASRPILILFTTAPLPRSHRVLARGMRILPQ
jgi:hypothetical protein